MEGASHARPMREKRVSMCATPTAAVGKQLKALTGCSGLATRAAPSADAKDVTGAPAQSRRIKALVRLLRHGQSSAGLLRKGQDGQE